MFLVFRDLENPPPHQIPLESGEIRHLRARRLSPGAEAALGDGKGKRWSGILAPDQKSILLDHPERPLEKKEGRRILCSALPAGNRWDWLLQKAVELGVTDIHPLIFQYSERREYSLSRGRRIILEAAAQARRFTLPLLAPPVELRKIGETLPAGIQPLVFHRESSGESAAPEERVVGVGGSRKEVVVGDPAVEINAAIIGPEGGFTAGELAYFRERGWPLVALGDNILRVETAALAALVYFLIQGGETRIGVGW